MLHSLVRLSEDAAGIEKTLRLFQGLCTIAAGLSWSSLDDAASWAHARSELALGRRYFRLLKWHHCWTSAWQTFNSNDKPPLTRLLEVAKWSFLGMYFFLEMPTLTNTMRVTNYAWGPVLVLEANKFWFYAITLSIVISLFQLLNSSSQHSSPSKGRSEKTAAASVDKKSAVKKTNTEPPPYIRIFRQLVVDVCDLIIAGSTVGWVNVEQVQVGIAYVISTSIAGQQIWNRINP